MKGPVVRRALRWALRRRPALFIHLFLLVQMALPLWYYVGREDKNDERFAWRMFSPVHELQCVPRFTIGDPPEEHEVRLYSVFHEAWVTIARRGRLDAIEAMGRHLCDENDTGARIRVQVTCQTLDDERIEYGGDYDFCIRESLR